MLAVFMAFILEEGLLTGSDPICFIDNLGVVCNMTTDTSNSGDIFPLVRSLASRVSSLGCRPGWEHAQGIPYIAVGRSQAGASDEASRALGIHLMHRQMSTLSQGWRTASLDCWQRWWASRS